MARANGKGIVRRPDYAGGGITDAEREQMAAHVRLWVSRAFRTDPIERDKITPAILGLYGAANLPAPRVVIVPSPLVMALAGGVASAWWGCPRRSATNAATAMYVATRVATATATNAARATLAATDAALAATNDATHVARATYEATFAATFAADPTRAATDVSTANPTFAATLATAATRAATFASTDAATANPTLAVTYASTDAATATYAATYEATRAAAAHGERSDWFVSLCEAYGVSPIGAASLARDWPKAYQGGNMWPAPPCFLSACRDILGLRLAEHAAYAHWEAAAIHGGFRWMAAQFCLVCDFPEILRVDGDNRPHCDDGPSHRWRDGWSLWYLHGVAVDEQIVMRPESQTVEQIHEDVNEDRRALRIERYGWTRYLQGSGATCIDECRNEIEGTREALYVLPGGRRRFVATCATAKLCSLSVPDEVSTCAHARRWLGPQIPGLRINILGRT